MNKITYSLLALILAFMSMRSTSAQTANGTPWMGHAIDPTQKQFYLIDKDGKNNSITQENTLYLVNVAACKEAGNSRIFFNQGGHWGTEASLFEIGIPVWLVHRGTGTKGSAIVELIGDYQHPDAADGNHIGVITGSSDPSHQTGDDLGVYIDRLRGENETAAYVGTDWELFKDDNKNNEYYIRAKNVGTDRFGTYYLTYANSGKTGARKYVIGTERFASGTKYRKDANRWVIVTRKDLIDRFEETPGSYRDLADASFLIYDQNLSRENGAEAAWITNIPEGSTATVRVGNLHSSRAEHKSTEGDHKSFTPLTETDKQYTSYPAGYPSGVYPPYNVMYGQFYNGEIKGGVGQFYQYTQKIQKAGLYMISCQGFYKPGDGSKKQYAGLATNSFTAIPTGNPEVPYQKQYVQMTGAAFPLWKEGGPTNLTESGMTFYANKDNYITKSIVWANEGDYIEFGVMVENQTSNPAEDWAVFDNFQMKYLGGLFPMFENFENMIPYNAFGDQQFQTMALLRNFQINKWNSFIVPVDLNKDQIYTAFGNNVKLAKLKGLDHEGKNIAFETVDIDAIGWDDIAIHKNKAYLIMPMKDGERYLEITWPPLAEALGKETVKTTGPHYFLPGVSLNTSDITVMDGESYRMADGKTITLKTNFFYSNDSNTEHGKIQASPDNFIYVMNKGALTRYQHPFALKGTRWYLEYTEDQPGGAKILITDPTKPNPTSIETLKEANEKGNNRTAKGIYDINGRKVSNGSSTEDLPVGIFVVDGKKIVVY